MAKMPWALIGCGRRSFFKMELCAKSRHHRQHPAMRHLSLFFACALLLTGCKPAIKGTWRAVHTRGDDPALAMEITREGNHYSGAMFLINADTPNDFAHGRQFPMTIKSVDEHGIHYSVEFLSHEPDELLLALTKPVEGPAFHGVMSTVDGRGEPIDFNFERVLEK